MKNKNILFQIFLIVMGILFFFIFSASQCPKECFNNDDCRNGFYCEKEAGNCEGKGTCQAVPEVCTEIYAPVCGCDGKTYDNDCFASASGVNVAEEGKCDFNSECLNNEDCKTESEYCAKEQGDCEGLGSCQVIPEVCAEIYAPVCGCDGEDYSNDCVAASAGVNVLSMTTCDNATCPVADCGPALGMPNYTCQDGSQGGPTGRCLKNQDGTCGWEIRICPEEVE